MKAFSDYHPIVLFVFFLSVLVLTMFTLHPVLLAISLLAAVCLSLLLSGRRRFLSGLLLTLAVAAIIAVTNPLFSHEGDTVLFALGALPVTLEALLFGAALGGMIAAVIYWFRCYNVAMTSDKFLYLFGRVAPRLALVVSMALRMVPKFRRQMRTVGNAQRAMGLNGTGFRGKIRSSLRIVSVLITWALESAVITADSMNARGYGLRGRTAYSPFRFRLRDGVMLAAVLALLGATIAGLAGGGGDFAYYPLVSAPALTTAAWVAWGGVFLLMFLPVLVQCKERLQWRYLRWKK